jgi:hypothetical protein
MQVAADVYLPFWKIEWHDLHAAALVGNMLMADL